MRSKNPAMGVLTLPREIHDTVFWLVSTDTSPVEMMLMASVLKASAIEPQQCLTDMPGLLSRRNTNPLPCSRSECSVARVASVAF